MLPTLRLLLALCASALTCASAAAQAFPARTVSIVVPYGAGGATDVFARTYATELAARLRQTVIVENVPGAGGSVGVQRVMNSAPDGYTLVVATGIEYEMLELADPTAAKGRKTVLAPVALIGTQPMVLVARSGLRMQSVDDLVKAARAKPGGLSLASAGPGTSLHLAGEMIQKAAGIQLLNVPYKATPQIVNDLVGGSVDLAVLTVPSAVPHVKAGTLTALGVTDLIRSPALPDVPPLNDSSVTRGINTKVWYGVFGPPGLPAPVVQVIADATAAMVKDAPFREKLLGLMITPAPSVAPEESKPCAPASSPVSARRWVPPASPPKRMGRGCRPA